MYQPDSDDDSNDDIERDELGWPMVDLGVGD